MSASFDLPDLVGKPTLQHKRIMSYELNNVSFQLDSLKGKLARIIVHATAMHQTEDIANR